MNENETNAAPIVPPTSASGCSKSESDTPRTDTFYDDHLDFGYYESDEWHKFASQLERELSITVAALKTIAESNYSISATEPTAFANVMGAKMALHRIHTLNPIVDGTADEQAKKGQGT